MKQWYFLTYKRYLALLGLLAVALFFITMAHLTVEDLFSADVIWEGSITCEMLDIDFVDEVPQKITFTLLPATADGDTIIGTTTNKDVMDRFITSTPDTVVVQIDKNGKLILKE